MRLVVAAVLVLSCAGPAAEAGDGLNCRDGKDAPPRLAARPEPLGAVGLSVDHGRVAAREEARRDPAAGFDAFDVWVGDAKEEDLARWEAGAKASGLAHRRRVRADPARGRRRGDRGGEAPRLRVPRRARRELLHARDRGGGAAARPRRAVPAPRPCRSSSRPTAGASPRTSCARSATRSGFPTCASTSTSPTTSWPARWAASSRRRRRRRSSSSSTARSCSTAASRTASRCRWTSTTRLYARHVERTSVMWKHVMVRWLKDAARGDVFPFRVELGPPDYAILGGGRPRDHGPLGSSRRP